jgi:hypothetical protein
MKDFNIDFEQQQNFSLFESCLSQISELQAISEIIEIKLESIDINMFYPDLDSALLSISKFIKNKTAEESKSTNNEYKYKVLQKTECTRLETIWQYITDMK